MRVVYFIDHLRPDGTQRFLGQLVEGLARRGHTQSVVCLNDSWSKQKVEQLRQGGAEVRVVGRLPLVCGYGLVSLWLWLRRRRFDAAVTLLFYSDVIGRAAAKAAGVPRIISSIRARNIVYTPLQLRAVRWTMPWADSVVLNGAAVRDFAVKAEGARPDRIHVIPNGVTLPDRESAPTREAVRRDLGLEPGSLLIGGVGRLDRQKGFDLLLRALASMDRPDVHLLLVGEGGEEQPLRDLASQLGIAARIHFAGYRPDAPLLMTAFDAFVQPSRFEGMPNALLEAMAARCPVIATSVDGARELIEDRVHGLLVPLDDVEAQAGAIEEVLSEPERAGHRADAAFERVTRQFTVAAMVSAWEEVLSGRDGSPSQRGEK